MPRSFLAVRLAAGGELGDRARGRGLGRLAAGVGVDLGVEHQDVDVARPRPARGRGRRSRCRRPSRRRRRSRRLRRPGRRPRCSRSAGSRTRRCSASCSRSSHDPRRAGSATPASSPWSASSEAGRRARRRARRPASATQLAGAARPGCRRPGACRGRTRRCPRTASWTRPARGRRRRCPTAWSAGCRRRSTSSRWRWRPRVRSPKSWVSSFRYGVSPHPAQAPENSNSGGRDCAALRPCRAPSRPGGNGAMVSKKANDSRSAATNSSIGRHVERLALDLLLGAGRADVDADPTAGAVVGGDLDGQAEVVEVAGPEGLRLQRVRAPRRAPRVRRA